MSWVPSGTDFKRMLFLTVIPLVFCVAGAGRGAVGRRGNLGRIGLKTFGFFVLTMTLAVVIGLGAGELRAARVWACRQDPANRLFSE